MLEKSLVEYEEDHNQSCEMLDVLLEACQGKTKDFKIARLLTNLTIQLIKYFFISHINIPR